MGGFFRELFAAGPVILILAGFVGVWAYALFGGRNRSRGVEPHWRNKGVNMWHAAYAFGDSPGWRATNFHTGESYKVDGPDAKHAACLLADALNRTEQ